jgi:hypothetical protein
MNPPRTSFSDRLTAEVSVRQAHGVSLRDLADQIAVEEVQARQDRRTWGPRRPDAAKTQEWETRIHEWCAGDALPDRAEDLILAIGTIAPAAEPTAWLKLWHDAVFDANDTAVNGARRDQNIRGGQHNAAGDQTVVGHAGNFYYNSTIIHGRQRGRSRLLSKWAGVTTARRGWLWVALHPQLTAVCILVLVLSLIAISVVFIPHSKEGGNEVAAPPKVKQERAPAEFSSVFSDDFSRPDSATWGEKWKTGITPKRGRGFGALVRDGVGILETSDLGHHAADASISRRANYPLDRDVEMRFSFKFDESESYPIAMIRSTSSVDGLGYVLGIQRDGYWVNRQDDYVHNRGLGVVKLSFSEGIWYSVAFAVTASDIRAKVWRASSAEPLDWDLEATDNSIKEAGDVGVKLGPGKTETPSRWYIDNFSLRSYAAAPTTNPTATATR